MEIKDLEISVELADVRGGVADITNATSQFAQNFGPYVAGSQRQGRNVVGSAMSMSIHVDNPQSNHQSNSTEQFLDNSGVIDASRKVDISVALGGLRRRLVRA